MLLSMKRIYLAALLLSAASTALAGDYVTNTNQSVAFLRNPARNATHDIDALYSNPAGAGFFRQGWQFSINSQTAFQTRNISTTFAPFKLNADGQTSADGTRRYKGTAAAPIVPSVYAAYKTGPWTFGLNFGLLGGGGKAQFKQGLPDFEMGVFSQFSRAGAGFTGLGKGLSDLLGGVQGMVAAGLVPPGALAGVGADMAGLTSAAQQLQTTGAALTQTPYRYTAQMRGRQYVFGLTLGSAYRVSEHFSVYGGLRFNYATAHYEGSLGNIALTETSQVAAGVNALNTANTELAKFKPMVDGLASSPLANNPAVSQAVQGYQQLVAGATQLTQGVAQLNAAGHTVRELNVDQKAFAVSPVISVNYANEDFSIAAKYEFKTALRMKNKTSVNTIGMADYADGKTVRADIPAMLSLGGEYKGLAKTRISAGYHYYFDKDAKWGAQGDRQKSITRNTSEVLLGAEYDINNKLTASIGGQLTDYGLSDAYQQTSTFSCDSYSIGLGVAYKVSPKVRLNVAYFTTIYSDYKAQTLGGVQAPTTYERTNHVVGVGVDFSL